jgi:2-keto-4-pentenoate hydratase
MSQYNAANNTTIIEGGPPARRIIYALAGRSYISFRGGAMRGAGEIVLPGSMTPIYPVDAADKVEAEFEALGSVSARFV